MALVKKSDITTEGQEEKFNSSFELPKDRYQIRCKKEEAVIAKSSGNYQYIRTWEIVSPESIVINGVTVRIAGTELSPQYLAIKCVEDKDGQTAAERTINAQKRLFKENARLGLPEEVDTENASLLCEGIIADAICNSKTDVMRKEPTEAQKAKGQLGDEIKDGEGKSLTKYYPQLFGFDPILGLAKAQM